MKAAARWRWPWALLVACGVGVWGCAIAQAPVPSPSQAAAPVPAARASAAPSAGRIWVLRATGGRQCESAGASLAEHRALLQGAGVVVSAERCASDGRMRVAMCGAADGRLNALEVPAAALPQAQKLGFQAMATMPGAQFIDCR